MSKQLIAIGNQNGIRAVSPNFDGLPVCGICGNPATHQLFGEWLCEECDPIAGMPPAELGVWDRYKDADYYQAVHLDYRQTTDDLQGRH